MAVLYVVAATVSVALWLPIFAQFLRSWRNRRNPISLAVCASIMLIMWTSLGGIWVAINRIENNVFLLTTVMLSMVVSLYSHLAFFWSNRRFVDERAREQHEQKP